MNANGRAPNGRFMVGNPGGPKGPRHNAVSQWIKLILERDGNAEAIAQVIVDLAKAGDHRFVEILLDRTEGKVKDGVDLTTDIRTTVVCYVPRAHNPRDDGRLTRNGTTVEINGTDRLD
jgi:hypothetical protein